MDVLAVTGGKDKDAYEKVVVLLHGGGMQGTSWEYQYDQGWFGNLTGLKYVFPTTVLPGHVWYSSYKNGCGLADDCAYNRSSIEDSAARVAALLTHEQALVGGDSKKTYLGGFSEGAQLTSYIQLAKLNYALGGAIVMDGFPLPPLFDLPGHSRAAAEKNLTYYGDDMAWMIWHGDADPIFPVKLTMSTYAAIFDLLGVADTVKVNHTEPGMTHTLIGPEFDAMVKFIRG
jgi:predicted esterase